MADTNPNTNQPPEKIREPGKGVESASSQNEQAPPLEVPGQNQTPAEIPERA